MAVGILSTESCDGISRELLEPEPSGAHLSVCVEASAGPAKASTFAGVGASQLPTPLTASLSLGCPLQLTNHPLHQVLSASPPWLMVFQLAGR